MSHVWNWLLILVLLAAVISLGWTLVADIAAAVGQCVAVPLWAHVGSFAAMVYFLVWFVRDVIRGCW